VSHAPRWPNVRHHRYGADWRSSVFERAYLEEMFEALAAGMGSAFESTRFLLFHHNTYWRPLPELDEDYRDAVLIWLADENGHVPREWAGRFRAIFKAYWPLPQAVGNLHPFPLGISDAVASHPVIGWDDRDIPVFFSGNLNANRVDLYRSLTWLRWVPPFELRPYLARRIYWAGLKRVEFRKDFSARFPPGSIFRFSDGFGQGLAGDDFAGHLARTRIAVCPMGFRSVECFRHFEAMKLGCVILSPPLPPNPFYRDSPIVVIDRWRDLGGLVKGLLADPSGLRERSQATLRWWEDRCSPRAAADQIRAALA